ncbi:MAG: protoporphyrinogen oxidase, partial [Acidobacteria bacterium]|nr:protoporphyrinogen oxidase [Acidobacteriota bacterium]
ARFARSFVVRAGRLHPTPAGFYLVAPSRLLPFLTTPLLGLRGKIRAGLDLILPPRTDDADESIGEFVLRRLGRETLDRIAQPMITAVHGGDPMKLSLLSTFPRFREMERRHGSLIRALWAGGGNREETEPAAGGASGPRYSLFMSFDAGIQVLVDRLAARLPGGALRTGCRVEAIDPDPGGGWRIRTGSGRERFDAVILALPGPQAAPLAAGFDPELGRRIGAVPYGPSATVSLGWRESDIGHPMDGIGFVVPRLEGLSILGCTFCHRKFPGRAPGGHALLRAFLGRETAGMEDGEIVSRAGAEIGRLLGIRAEPGFAEVSRYPEGLPHYPVGHRVIVAGIQDRLRRHPGLALAGNAYSGVGIPDCIASGEAAAEALLRYLFPAGSGEGSPPAGL